MSGCAKTGHRPSHRRSPLARLTPLSAGIMAAANTGGESDGSHCGAVDIPEPRLCGGRFTPPDCAVFSAR